MPSSSQLINNITFIPLRYRSGKRKCIHGSGLLLKEQLLSCSLFTLLKTVKGKKKSQISNSSLSPWSLSLRRGNSLPWQWNWILETEMRFECQLSHCCLLPNFARSSHTMVLYSSACFQCTLLANECEIGWIQDLSFCSLQTSTCLRITRNVCTSADSWVLLLVGLDGSSNLYFFNQRLGYGCYPILISSRPRASWDLTCGLSGFSSSLNVLDSLLLLELSVFLSIWSKDHMHYNFLEGHCDNSDSWASLKTYRIWIYKGFTGKSAF